MHPDRARLTIDLDALAHNRAVIADATAGAEVAAVVKADGYGLGAGPIARRLHTEGTTSFFVARLAEGQALRTELRAREAAIYVLDGLLPGTAGSPRRRAAHAGHRHRPQPTPPWRSARGSGAATPSPCRSTPV
jgi:alanine racemase